MSVQLTTPKRLLTHYSKKLDTILTTLKNDKLEKVSVDSDEEEISPIFIRKSLQRLDEGIGAIEAATSKIGQLLQEYATEFANLETPSSKDKEDFEEYTNMAQNAITSAFDYVLLLEARIRAFKSCNQYSQRRAPVPMLSATETIEQVPLPIFQSKPLDLPTLPIPKFSGNIWEWDNFWELFDANVHSQDLPELFKFNYLLNALHGEALESVKKFQVTKENYNKALQFLKHKYGNSEELVFRLIDKLDACSLRSPSIRDQRTLFEHLQVIVTQLIQKGEHVDSQWLVRRVLSKFSNYIQRKVLAKKQAINADNFFRMETLLTYLEEIISSEEMMALYIGKNDPANSSSSNQNSKKPKTTQPFFSTSCMYCGGNHKSFECNKYKTPQERSQYLRDHKLCLICASAQHTTSQCKKRPCFKCQKLHHTSCCFKSTTRERTTYEKPESSNQRRKTEVTYTTKDTKTPKTRINHLCEELPIQEETIIMGLQEKRNAKKPHETFLPTGEMTIMDPSSKKLRKISALLDTGAEISFIDSALANELNLPTLEETKVRLRTFGSEQVQEKLCRRVPLQIWDAEGKPFYLYLLTHDILTKSLVVPPISNEDAEFIRAKDPNIKLSKDKLVVKPSILLGCDQLWSLIHNDKPHIPLPSGLNLLPTRLGHLLTGQIKDPKQQSPTQLENTERDRWDGYWTLDGQVNTIKEVSPTPLEESEMWDKYWALESAGTDEFSSPEKEAKALIDKQVWDKFNKSIEKREDGYYVRLPWKNTTTSLPDNRAIALCRLTSVWNSLRTDDQLLDKYNSIFRNQIELQILEEINENAMPRKTGVHYIPHQAVLTPQKTTTKMRIVYDASAHYKGCPSLNDVLHRGPVILPLLFGVLLRFRFGRIALISDIEKAFLQVRLHENDRDYTRCLWLYDHKKPPKPDNIKVLRFTRVTFGLVTSPFLLAGTIHFHLDQYKEDTHLVEEIKTNTYVDNLILTVDTVEEARHIYTRTKQVFKELNMNIREFASNNSHIMNTIEEKDKFTEASPKVLGIAWNLTSDCLHICCAPKIQTQVTKRTVASTIAAVYDPLGWMLPLLHKAKVFLRSLWEAKYDWDTSLPQDLENTWTHIREDMQGFEKTLPRHMANKQVKADLFTFADASTEAIASCLYLRVYGSCDLLMAKGKLPSLKSKSTIPKMELDAITLALRLTSSVITELSSTIQIRQVIIWSDSEIALSWIKKRPLKNVGLMVLHRLMEIGKIIEHLESLGHQVLFGHIPSEQNPADCATRGLTQHELRDHFWWTGPPILTQSQNDKSFNAQLFHLDEGEKMEILPQQSKEILATTGEFSSETKEGTKSFSSLEKYTFLKAKRIMAIVLRYIRALVSRINDKQTHHIHLSSVFTSISDEGGTSISGPEIILAGKLIVKYHQRSKITPAILKSLHHLNIKPDREDLLRCFGRLGNSELKEATKSPLIVLQNSWLAEAIIQDCHDKGHPGISHTMSIVRQKFWIPKLRAQVTRIVRRCVQCQRYNNLPYKYPEQGNLPEQRVQRSRPFAHVGLDYFGPLSITNVNDGDEKCYGCIITCMVTRLIHLDVVSDLTTEAFIMMLRRFFGRRGLPKSITSDNAPTFNLGENILNECLQAVKNDPMVGNALSNREIQWRHITPYAPWKGGFYERLIKSIKYSLYKSLGKAKLSFEHLSTVIIEIEALLNTRPLLYVESESPDEQVLRPIDFLQNGFEVPYPLDKINEETEDPSYVPAEEQVMLRTRSQVMSALHTSCKFTEKFWEIWRTHYLTSLREKHQREVGRKRGSIYSPKKDDLVLISEPIQPRHSWKMGRIHELVSNSEDIIREAVVMLPSHRKIRRPINLLIPLELEDSYLYEEHKECDKQEAVKGDLTGTKKSTNHEDNDHKNLPQMHQPHKYDLRPKKHVNYKETTIAQVKQVNQIPMVLCLLLSLVTIIGASSSAGIPQTNHSRRITCIPGGIELVSQDRVAYEVCAEDFCKTYETPQVCEEVKLPPQIILHEHQVQWKFADNDPFTIIETTCQAAPFCEHIDCVLCSTVILNPECWPVGAILATMVLIYFFITGCYVFLYVPLTIGRPIRIMTSLIWRCICFPLSRVLRNFWKKRPRSLPKRPTDLVELLAITCITLELTRSIQCCQQVNLFSHLSTICFDSDEGQICRVHLSEILKINPFKKEACFKLLRNETSIHEIRAKWKALVLVCESETELFTRNTIYHVVDSKRCPHTGSCVGSKCDAVNTTSLLPELKEGNNYPGVTACVESCGGPGCDCFYWSSGCLFYRIYLTPTSSEVYEIFHCNRWSEAAKIEVKHVDILQGRTSSYIAYMQPNVPLTWKSFTFTLSSITVPPTPRLNTPFITDGKHTAIWDPHIVPPLQCQHHQAAKNLSCEIMEDCTCFPAETHANCKCKDVDISKWFNALEHRLPVVYPSLSFRRNYEGQVQATVTSMTTAEIILTIQDNLKTDIIVNSAICKIDNTILTGCYNCAKGAQAQVVCFSTKEAQAEVVCGSISFTVECNKKGKKTTLLFSFANARIHETCSVSCGILKSNFELGGILKFIHTPNTMVNIWLEGRTTGTSEFQWPDFWHIADVFLQCMNAQELDGDLTFLFNFLDNANPTTSNLENDSKLTREALLRQVDIAKTIRTDWDHLSGDKSFVLGGPGEQVLLICRLLRTAGTTKEKILRLTTRLTMLDRLHEKQAEVLSRKGWLKKQGGSAKDFLYFINRYLRHLGTLVKELEGNLQNVERSLRKAEEYSQQLAHAQGKAPPLVVENTSSTSLQVEHLQNKLSEKEEEIEFLRKKIQLLMDERKQEKRVDTTEKNMQTDEEDEQAELEPVEDVTDQDYFERMVDEIKEEKEPSEMEVQEYYELHLEPISSDEEEEEEEEEKEEEEEVQEEVQEEEEEEEEEEDPNAQITSKIRFLRERVHEMERILRVFPYRNIGESSRGVDEQVQCAFCQAMGQHYSDSCPQVLDGDRRYHLALGHGLCKHCLDTCPRGRCKFRPRECWYCSKLRGTIAEDLIPQDGGHHRALCNIPDSKEILELRINEERSEITELEASR